jgi:hypothetical protein
VPSVSISYNMLSFFHCDGSGIPFGGTKFLGHIRVPLFATFSTGAFPWVVICAAKLLDLLVPTRLLTGGLCESGGVSKRYVAFCRSQARENAA